MPRRPRGRRRVRPFALIGRRVLRVRREQVRLALPDSTGGSVAASSNIVVTHAETGVVTAEVVHAIRLSPNFVRLTLAGDELREWRHLGFDQWFRLAVPTSGDTRFDNLADTFDTAGYLRYLTLPRATRPVIRNYTVREFRADDLEL